MQWFAEMAGDVQTHAIHRKRQIGLTVKYLAALGHNFFKVGLAMQKSFNDPPA
jgi:hypothetical protein